MSGGELSQFLIYAVYVAISAASLSEMWGEVQRAAGAMERLVELSNATPAIVAPAASAAVPDSGAGSHPLRGCFLPLSVAARLRSRSTASRSTSDRARTSRSSAPRAPARARRSSCCCASTIRRPAASSSTASTSPQARPEDVRSAHRPGAAGNRAVRRQCAREHPLRPARRERRGDRSGRARRGRGLVHPPAARRLRHVPRRARHAAVGRPAPAHCDRAGAF